MKKMIMHFLCVLKDIYRLGWRETIKRIMLFSCILIVYFFFILAVKIAIEVISIQFYVPLSPLLIAYDIIVILYVLLLFSPSPPRFLGVKENLWTTTEKIGDLYHAFFCIVLFVFGFFIIYQNHDVYHCINESKNTQECIEAQSEILPAP